MKHYLKPTLEKNPQQILLNNGKNHLRDQNPNTVADNILDLAQTIESETNARVVLLELMTRSDKVTNDSIKTVNKKLRTFCNQNNWQLVQHQNITSNDQNKSGLHLNYNGNNGPFKNFVNWLNTNQWPFIDTYVLQSRSPNDHRLKPPSKNEIYSFLPSKRGIKIANLIITSLLNRIDELRVLLANSPVDICQ